MAALLHSEGDLQQAGEPSIAPQAVRLPLSTATREGALSSRPGPYMVQAPSQPALQNFCPGMLDLHGGHSGVPLEGYAFASLFCISVEPFGCLQRKANISLQLLITCDRARLLHSRRMPSSDAQSKLSTAAQ